VANKAVPRQSATDSRPARRRVGDAPFAILTPNCSRRLCLSLAIVPENDNRTWPGSKRTKSLPDRKPDVHVHTGPETETGFNFLT